MLQFLFWPFTLCGWLISLLLGLFGRLLCFILGGCLLVSGLLLCATLLGALAGIPLLLLGTALIFRSVF